MFAGDILLYKMMKHFGDKMNLWLLHVQEVSTSIFHEKIVQILFGFRDFEDFSCNECQSSMEIGRYIQ